MLPPKQQKRTRQIIGITVLFLIIYSIFAFKLQEKTSCECDGCQTNFIKETENQISCCINAQQTKQGCTKTYQRTKTQITDYYEVTK